MNQVYDIHGNWMESIFKYLDAEELPDDELQAHQIRIKSAQYSMIEGQLYRRSYNGPYLRCLDLEKMKYVLSKLHERVCGPGQPIEPTHKGATSLPCIRTPMS